MYLLITREQFLSCLSNLIIILAFDSFLFFFHNLPPHTTQFLGLFVVNRRRRIIYQRILYNKLKVGLFAFKKSVEFHRIESFQVTFN